jgi:hypothetical protein
MRCTKKPTSMKKQSSKQRVKIENLPERKKQLTEEQAKQIKGGLAGGYDEGLALKRW